MNRIETIEDLMRRRADGWWGHLCEIVPELKALTGVRQPPAYHAEGDVATHTRMAIEICPDHCDPDLRWVALLHDIGKPATTLEHEDGCITAHGHAKTGAELAEAILARLKMPAERSRRIVWAIRHHMFHHAWQLSDPAALTKRQRGYLTHRDFPLLLEFLRIDATASHSCSDGLQAYRFYHQLWAAVSGGQQ